MTCRCSKTNDISSPVEIFETLDQMLRDDNRRPVAEMLPVEQHAAIAFAMGALIVAFPAALAHKRAAELGLIHEDVA
jgi:hypothetical protein